MTSSADQTRACMFAKIATAGVSVMIISSSESTSFGNATTFERSDMLGTVVRRHSAGIAAVKSARFLCARISHFGEALDGCMA